MANSSTRFTVPGVGIADAALGDFPKVSRADRQSIELKGSRRPTSTATARMAGPPSSNAGIISTPCRGAPGESSRISRPFGCITTTKARCRTRNLRCRSCAGASASTSSTACSSAAGFVSFSRLGARSQRALELLRYVSTVEPARRTVGDELYKSYQSDQRLRLDRTSPSRRGQGNRLDEAIRIAQKRTGPHHLYRLLRGSRTAGTNEVHRPPPALGRNPVLQPRPIRNPRRWHNFLGLFKARSTRARQGSSASTRATTAGCSRPIPRSKRPANWKRRTLDRCSFLHHRQLRLLRGSERRSPRAPV